MKPPRATKFLNNTRLGRKLDNDGLKRAGLSKQNNHRQPLGKKPIDAFIYQRTKNHSCDC